MKKVILFLSLVTFLGVYTADGQFFSNRATIQELLEGAKETGKSTYGMRLYDIRKIVKNLKKEESVLLQHKILKAIESTGKYGLLIQFLDEGVISLDYSSHGQRNLFHVILGWRYTEEYTNLIKYLVKKGFNPGQPQLKMIGEKEFGNGDTPIHILTDKEDIPPIEFIELVNFLLSNGGDLHAKNKKKYTPCQLLEISKRQDKCEIIALMNSFEKEINEFPTLPPCFCLNGVSKHFNKIGESDSSIIFLLVKLSGAVMNTEITFSVNGKELEFLDTTSQHLIIIPNEKSKVTFTYHTQVQAGSSRVIARANRTRSPTITTRNSSRRGRGNYTGPKTSTSIESYYIPIRPIENYITFEPRQGTLNKLVLKKEITNYDDALAGGGKYKSGVKIGNFILEAFYFNPESRLQERIIESSFELITK